MPVRIKNRGLPSVLELASLIFLFLLVILIAGSIVYNLKNRGHRREELKPTESNTRAYQEKFQALDFAGEKMRLRVKADRSYIDADGKQHLEGKVEIIDQEVAAGVRLEAARMVLDPEKNLVRTEGETRLMSEKLLVEAGEFEYDIKDKVARAGQVRLERDGFSLTAGQLFYRAGNGRAELEKNVAGQVKQEGEQLSFASSRLIIEPDGQSFWASDLRLTAGPMTLKAGQARVRLSEGKAALDFASLEGGANVWCEFKGDASDFQKIHLLSGRIIVQAVRQVSVIRAPGLFEIKGSGKEWQLQGSGEGLEFSVEDGQSPSRFKAGLFRSSLKEVEGEEFQLSGQEADWDLTTGLLRLSGQAEAGHRHFALKSESLEFKLEDRSLAASVFNLEIRPGFFSLPALIFDREKSVYLSGQRLVSQPGFFDLKEAVRIWQNEAFCQAETARMEGKTARFHLEKLSRASWELEREGGRRERLEVRADRASFQPEENRGVLSGNVELSLGSLRLGSEELILAFSAETRGQLLTFEARRRVGLFWKGYRASGRRAEVDLPAEKLTLTGVPQLVTGSGERLEADKLTLFFTDDRIRLESQERERSLTILVRGK
ncbi:MAG: LPS export ABC transporter periplasmic protein LptC [Candidatus Saccharicenans sp.]|nr:LPS export ABC transporter periplasmic protein LptC [Candidatus Saccharicenans sp.]